MDLDEGEKHGQGESQDDITGLDNFGISGIRIDEWLGCTLYVVRRSVVHGVRDKPALEGCQVKRPRR